VMILQPSAPFIHITPYQNPVPNTKIFPLWHGQYQ
jgi:hypothetical protein